MLLASYQVLLGHTPTSYLFSILPRSIPPPNKGSSPELFPPLPIPCLGLHPGPSDGNHSQDLTDILAFGKATSKATPEGPPSLKWQEITPLHKVLMRSFPEAFSWDTHLVRKTREEHFRNHCPNFNNENTCDLMDIFQCTIETAGLLGSAIYEIQEAWTGQDVLQHV